MKDKDEHFWIEDVINRLPSELVPDKRDWSSVLTALTKLKTERNNAVVERNELAAHVERLRGALTGLESACKACADAHGLDVYADLCEAAGNACRVLEETPAQSLEAVKREWAESVDSVLEGFAFTTSEGQWVVHRDDVSGLLSK